MIFNAYTEQKEQAAGITVVSCGHIFAKPGREICRPRGREDWLLFYVAKENETFFLHKEVAGKAGSFILFAPGEKQHHIYKGNKTAEFYYVHFKCSGLPRELSLTTFKLYELPFSRQVCTAFEELIEETLQKRPLYEALCAYKLLQLLALLNRNLVQETHPHRENFERIALAVQHMNKNYSSDLGLADYAAMCNMSKHHFLRVFCQLTGSTPLSYRNNIRLEHAAEMLQEKRHTVEEIGLEVGYTAASYFSTAFKRKYGVSPKQYQLKE